MTVSFSGWVGGGGTFARLDSSAYLGNVMFLMLNLARIEFIFRIISSVHNNYERQKTSTVMITV